ncbi:MAG: DUF4956 domain-containing protein [Verrucomicrobiales bacterium]|nr:DUF4956 domain-containing protein [Verrucomicrobiales bacterium]
MKGTIFLATILAALFGLVSEHAHAVPPEVEQSFEKQYPDAADPSWEVDDNANWEVNFLLKDEKQRADYRPNGEWLETEVSIRFEDLPDAIQTAVKRDYPGEDISEVEKVDSAIKGEFFDVEFSRDGRNRDVEYRANGETLKDFSNTMETAAEILFEPIPELNADLKDASEIGRLELFFEFAFNLLVIIIYAYFLYYRRHHDHKMLFLLLGFNLFLFPIFLLNSVLTAGVGFTIFALLALVRLRSDTFDKTEVAYLLGAVAITFINSVLPAKAEYVASVMVLATAYFGDHPRLWRDAYQNVEIRLPLDEISHMLDAEFLCRHIEEQFGVEVSDVEIMRVQKKQVRLQVMYRESLGETPSRKRLPLHGGPTYKIRQSGKS